jgi:hypothetical protein
MKLSNGQLIVLAGGVGLVGLYLMRKNPNEPFSLGGLFRTVMPNAPTDAQRAAWFAANAGGTPSAAGSYGYGATSSQPVYAGAMAGLGSFVSSLFGKLAGPGNAAPLSRPQSSASSGGGVSQPSMGFTDVFHPDLYFGYGDVTDNWNEPTTYVGGDGYLPPGGVMGDTTFDPFQGFGE